MFKIGDKVRVAGRNALVGLIVRRSAPKLIGHRCLYVVNIPDLEGNPRNWYFVDEELALEKKNIKQKLKEINKL